MKNMELWDALKRPPESVLKKIKGGRLSGMTDISPQWRYKVMTEYLGPCGVGWKYDIVEFWKEDADIETLAFCQINLYVKVGDEWSAPIPGIGGSKLVAQESKGMYVSDEAYKMALTDALSVSMKILGVASDIYMGLWDGSKYRDEEERAAAAPTNPVRKPLHEEKFEDDLPYEKEKAGINAVFRRIDESGLPTTEKTKLKEEAMKKPENVLDAWVKGFLEHKLKSAGKQEEIY